MECYVDCDNDLVRWVPLVELQPKNKDKPRKNDETNDTFEKRCGAILVKYTCLFVCLVVCLFVCLKLIPF